MASSSVAGLAERTWMAQGVQLGVRNDGRGPLGVRPSTIETGVLAMALGSAHVRRGATDVLVGIKPELEDADVGRVAVHVDCSASASADWEGKGGRELELVLGQMLERALTASMDAAKLRCAPGLAWLLYVDCVVLGDGGSLLDVLAMAVRCALMQLRLPKITPRTHFKLGANDAAAGTTRDFELTEDPHDFVALDTSDVPVVVTVCFIGASGELFLLDASREEESCCSARVSFALCAGAVCGTQQSGVMGIEPQQLHGALLVARQAADATVTDVERTVALEATQQRPKVFGSAQ